MKLIKCRQSLKFASQIKALPLRRPTDNKQFTGEGRWEDGKIGYGKGLSMDLLDLFRDQTLYSYYLNKKEKGQVETYD